MIKPSSQSPKSAHARVSTDTHERYSPVEPVICVAWKWERVVAAEVVAGIGILERPNGRAYKINATRREK